MDAYCDDDLSDEGLRAQIEEHLLCCPSCARAYRKHADFLKELQNLSLDVDLPPRFHDEWMQKLKTIGKSSKKNRFRMRVASSVAVLLVLAAVGTVAALHAGSSKPQAMETRISAAEQVQSSVAASAPKAFALGGALATAAVDSVLQTGTPLQTQDGDMVEMRA